MSGGIFSKLGRALSIFGVSNPEDIRKMQRSAVAARPLPEGLLPKEEFEQRPTGSPVSHPSHQTSTSKDVE